MSKNQRGKIEYWVLFHFPSEIFNLGRDPPQRYYLNRPTKFDFYAKLYNDNNVAEYECVGEMSNSKGGFSASSANAVGARTTRRTTTTTTTTIRPEQTVESSPEITVEELVAARKCVTLVRELIPNPYG
uniref:Uncharacterized protein n=1 Tax=Romanomermis culicivorax TaxID=13658 RepID=A0A915JDC3_ROMCU